MKPSARVTYSIPITSKLNYLLLVNSFFGLETPKNLPPVVAGVVPILSDEHLPLGKTYIDFLSTHSKAIYIALGAHVILRRGT
jgi:hypothetical protein